MRFSGSLRITIQSVRTTAVRALGKIGTENTVKPLIKQLAADKNPEFRICAIEALGNLNDKLAIEPLTQKPGG